MPLFQVTIIRQTSESVIHFVTADCPEDIDEEDIIQKALADDYWVADDHAAFPYVDSKHEVLDE